MARTVVGILGTFDLENYGDHLFPLIARQELSRRIPGVEVRAYSPFGSEHLTRLDSGDPARPLGPRDEKRCAEIADELDCVLVGGGEIIHTRDELLAASYGCSPAAILARRPSDWFILGLGEENEVACPVVWHAVGAPFDFDPKDAARLRPAVERRPYVAVRDELSLGRLREAGVTSEVAIVPDSGFVANRLFPHALLEKRAAYHRHMGWVPGQDEAYIVLQGNRDLVRFVPEIAEAIGVWRKDHKEVSVVLAETGVCHGDVEFANSLADLLRAPVFRFPETAGVRDTVSLIASAKCFVGISLHGTITASAYGRSSVILNLNGQSKLDGVADILGHPERLVRKPVELPAALEKAWEAPAEHELLIGLQARVDDHFDQVVTLIEASRQKRRRRPDAEALEFELEISRLEVDRLRRAAAIRSERLVEERIAMADELETQQREAVQIAARTDELQAETAELRARLEELEARRLDDEAGRTALEDELAAARVETDWLKAKAEELAARLDEEERAREAASKELEALRSTRTFRYTRRLRALYASLRTRSRP